MTNTTKKLLLSYFLFISISAAYSTCRYNYINKKIIPTEDDSRFMYYSVVHCSNITWMYGNKINLPDSIFDPLISEPFYLIIQNSNIPTLDKLMLNRKHASNVIGVELDNNKILRVNDFALTELLHLESLSITNNEFSIFGYVFFPHLKELILHHNKLTSLENIHVPNLEKLDVSHNQLNNYENFLLQLKQLKYLDLSSNHMYDINSTVFTEIPMLEELHLTNNTISHYPIGQFKNPIKKLNLSDNVIEQIIMKPDKLILNHLDLSFNIIDTIYEKQFANIENLYTLNISNNFINRIELNAFQNLNSLTLLNLNENLIENLAIGVFHPLKSLQSLNLSSNKIESLDSGIFTGLNKLQILDVSENKLQNIYSSVFHAMHNLEELYLHGNDLDVNADDFTKLKSLKHISIHFKNRACEKLIEFVKDLHFKDIQLRKGNHKNVHNVHGIACNPDIKYNKYSRYDDTEIEDYTNELKNTLRWFSIIIIILILFIIIAVIIVIVKVLSLFHIDFNYCRKFCSKQTTDNV